MRNTETERTYHLQIGPTRSILLGLTPVEATFAGVALLLGGVMLSARVPIPIAAAPALLVLIGSLRIVRGETLFTWAPAIVSYVAGARRWHAKITAGYVRADHDGEYVMYADDTSPFLPLPDLEDDTARSKKGSLDEARGNRKPRRAEGEGARKADRSEQIAKRRAWRASRRAVEERRRSALPIEMRSLSFVEHSAYGENIGIVKHGPRHIYTVVAQVSAATAFPLLPASERVSALASFGSIMDGLCTEDQRITGVTWSERVVPDLADDAAAHLQAATADPDLLADYRELVDQLDATAQMHEVYVGISVRADTLDEVDYEVNQFFGQFRSLNYRVDILSYDDLHILIQATLEGMPRGYYAHARYDLAHPSAEEVGWAHIRIDEMYHRAYAVQAWPRVPVGTRMLAPVLQAQTAGVSRILTVHWQPSKPSVAQRRVRMQIARAEAERETRRRAGFLVSAKADREAADARRRDEEQAAGYNEHRVAAVALVSAPTRDLLDGGARRFEQGANRSHLEVRPLWGRQREAWVAALPFGHVRFHTGILEF